MLTRSNQKFDSPDHLRQIVERLVEPLGIDLDQLPPLIEMTLTDYSLVHIILPPHADDIALTIIRRNPTPLTVQDLFQFGTLSPEEAEFLRACVVARVNVMIVGRKGVGKTTLLNVLGNFIPENERIITIEKHEKQPELQLPHDNRIALKTNAAGSDTQALVAHSLRMMPDRLIVGDCMGAEVAEVIQAVYHGVDGVLITVTANGIDDAIRRLETMSQLANDSRPQQQIGTAFDCIVHLERLEDGSRKITQITEALRKGSESIELKDIFTFEQTAEEQGKVIGRHRRTGYRPTFIPKIEAAGIVLPPTIYSRPIPGER